MESPEALFEQIKTEIRNQRSKFQYWSDPYYFLAQKRIRMSIESKKQEADLGYYLVYADKGKEGLWAESVPGREKIHIDEFGGELEKFIGGLLSRCSTGAVEEPEMPEEQYRKEREDREYGGD